ncbi:MAG: hypothetical protein CMJ94_10375 [Planctomycetes bacterium]|nr:hypothetical protein [Planctomycetota bacterium]
MLAAWALAAIAPAWQASSVILPVTALVQDEEPKVDSSKVRYGKLADVDLAKDKIGVVNSKKVYLEIPAYKTIVKDKIEKGSARYIQLMEEATAVYRSTLEKVAQDKSIKLIVETGGVSGVKTSELTDAIIEAL